MRRFNSNRTKFQLRLDVLIFLKILASNVLIDVLYKIQTSTQKKLFDDEYCLLQLKKNSNCIYNKFETRRLLRPTFQFKWTDQSNCLIFSLIFLGKINECSYKVDSNCTLEPF